MIWGMITRRRRRPVHRILTIKHVAGGWFVLRTACGRLVRFRELNGSDLRVTAQDAETSCTQCLLVALRQYAREGERNAA